MTQMDGKGMIMKGEEEETHKVFKEKINHLTGEREWTVADDDYDLIQEVARSRFGDMILDYDRNDRYEAALITVIKEKKSKGEYVHVLDIGTGTGLLSLMAARAGADRVTALEVFTPMAECAKKIIGQSEYADKITVIANRSTDLSHLGEKPNVIVAEVFDTELIGEGALRTFKEALENLVQPGCRVIPATAKFYVQGVESSTLCRFNNLPSIDGKREESERKEIMDIPEKRRCLIPKEENTVFVEGEAIMVDEKSPLGKECPGNCSVHDVQLSLIHPNRDFTPITDPSVVFEFNFEDSHSIVYNETAIVRMQATGEGTVDAFLAWWDLDMDRSNGGNTLTMAPEWKDADSRWRDHWMQAVYYPSKRMKVKEGGLFPLKAGHDEFSLWFDIHDERMGTIDRPYCVCEFHARLSRTMIYRMNEIMEDKKLAEAISKEVSLYSSHIVCLGEGSLIGLLPSITANALKVTIVESTPWMRKILHKYIQHYKLVNVTVVSSISEIPNKPSLLIGEPFFLSSVLTWENIPFWYEVEKIRNAFGDKSIPSLPQECSIRALPIKFRDLHNTAGRVGTVNGFDLSAFDELSEKARSAVDAQVEDYSLWEYEGKESEGWKDEEPGRVGVELIALKFDQSTKSEEMKKKIGVTGEMNGVAIWADWKFGDYWLTTGRKREDDLLWSIGHKQGVYFIPPNLLGEKEIHVMTGFDISDGQISFNFSRNSIEMKK